MRKPAECPKCKSIRVLRIEYGLPGGETPIGVYEGGCCIVVGDSPKWHCDRCYWEWGPDTEGRYCEDEKDDENGGGLLG